MSAYILPCIFILIFLYSAYKKVNCYDTFVKGAKSAIPLVLDIFPFVASIMIAVALLRISGITHLFSILLSPIFNFFGVPQELTELILLRPFTGAGSFALLNDVFVKFGADSYISRCACVILGCSETIFYVATVYFSQSKVKKLGYAIPVALLCAFVGAIFSCFLCKFI